MNRRGLLGLMAGLPAVPALAKLLPAPAEAPALPAASEAGMCLVSAGPGKPPVYQPLPPWTLERWEVARNFETDHFEVHCRGHDSRGLRVFHTETVSAQEIDSRLAPPTCGCTGLRHSSACSDVNVIFWCDVPWIPLRPTAMDYATQIALHRLRRQGVLI